MTTSPLQHHAFSGRWNYPSELPVVEHRQEIIDALTQHQVIVVVSDTGSGKTTQLPKMVAEAMGPNGGRIGCTQPRRLAAASVARRVAEELSVPLGNYVGYKVRFEDLTSRETRIKFMTDGILLAESQGDPDLKQYQVLILDEAHERSLNIDFLLGYLKRLLSKRQDLKLVISSATLDAGAFATFFANPQGQPSPIIQAPGRMFPVTESFLPAEEDEELPQHVARAAEWLTQIDPHGDTLVFLPGEREIRECADTLEGRQFPNTEILPLFARLSLADQQRVFNPGSKRRIILATNVAETSLTLPRIACVIDSGTARVNRWSPSKGVQRLQIEPISQASARQRKGRCGRIRAGVCVRLYDEEQLLDRPDFTDPEIRRSSLAGVILRMKSLGLPEIENFPFIDPPSPKSISEGYRTLREVNAIDRQKNLTDFGMKIAKLPVDPRLGRILIEAQKESCLAEILPIIAALESNDPRERPADKQREADAAHARWKDTESDFITLLRIWQDVTPFRDGPNRWKRNALRKFTNPAFLNARRIMEWANVADELKDLLEREWNIRIPPLSSSASFPYEPIHRALLAGVPRQFGLWDKETKSYRSANQGFFAVFPGSGLFSVPKRYEWVLAMELVETSKLWARRVAKIDPIWIEQVAPHLCRSHYGNAHWDEKQGAVYGTQTVVCGGLTIVAGRRIHYGRVDPKTAHEVFLRDGLLAGGIRKACRFIDHLNQLKEEIATIEHKLRRVGGLWSEEAVLHFFSQHIPADIHTAAAFHQWLPKHEDSLILETKDVIDEDLSDLGLEHFPDQLCYRQQEYPVYYRCDPGTRDDGVTIGMHIDQLPSFPNHLADWGVDGNLRERTEFLLRSLPKDLRRACQPIGPTADSFAERWIGSPKDQPWLDALSNHIKLSTGAFVPSQTFEIGKLPDHLITKIWICDDDGEEIALDTHLATLKKRLANQMEQRFEAAANAHIEASGMTSWHGDALAKQLETTGGAAYPALVDEKNSVGIKAFANPHEAQQQHRAGIARLLCLTQHTQVQHLSKKYPLGLMAKVELPRLGDGGTSLDDLILLAAEGALHRTDIRCPKDFHIACEAARSRWHDSATAVANSLDDSLERIPTIRSWISNHHKNRNYEGIAQDLDEQLLWLLRQRFAWRAGFAGIKDYPRHFKSIQSRIARLQSLPLVKDLEKMDRLRTYWSPWFQQWRKQPDQPELWPMGWALSEWRIALFSPEIPCLTKVSEKRIQDLLSSTPSFTP